MTVLLTCKNEEDPIENENARVVTNLYIDFSDAQGQITPESVVRSDRISTSFEILWVSLLPARMKKIRSKMNTRFSPIITLWELPVAMETRVLI